MSFVNNSDGKGSLKLQKSPTDAEDVSKVYWFYVWNVHISKHLSLLFDHISFSM